MAYSRALLSLKPTTTITLFTKFPHPSSISSFTPPTRSTAAARCFFSRGNNWDEDPLFTEDVVYSVNPLQISGPRKLVEIGTAKDNKDHKVVRVVLPGVGEGEYKAWINRENNAVSVEGEGKSELYGEDGRKYQGSVIFDTEDVKVEKIVRTDIRNGILKIVLAKNIGIRQSMFTVCKTDQMPIRTIPNVAVCTDGVGISQIVHPFQISGPKGVKEWDMRRMGKQILLRVRLVMPGVGEDGYEIKLKDNTLFFSGQGDIDDESEASAGRKYRGGYPFDPVNFKVNEFNSDTKNGILRIVVMGEQMRKF